MWYFESDKHSTRSFIAYPSDLSLRLTSEFALENPFKLSDRWCLPYSTEDMLWGSHRFCTRRHQTNFMVIPSLDTNCDFKFECKDVDILTGGEFMTGGARKTENREGVWPSYNALSFWPHYHLTSSIKTIYWYWLVSQFLQHLSQPGDSL